MVAEINIYTYMFSFLFGLLGFSINKMVEIKWTKPFDEFKKEIGKTIYIIKFYADFFANVISYEDLNYIKKNNVDEYNFLKNKLFDITSEIRGNACNLTSKYFLISKVYTLKRNKECNKAVEELSKNLIGISNTLKEEKKFVSKAIESNLKRADKIEKSLEILKKHL